MSVPEEDRAALEEALLAELFGCVYTTRDAAAEAASNLTLDEQNIWNEAVLPLHGIGEDHFYLNERFAAGTSILDFETLRDFDEDDYRFQQEARKKDDPSYAFKSYRGSLYLSWARLFVDGKFTYATLSMAAGYIYAELDSAAHDLLEQRIPHRFVPGKNHGKAEGDGWQWDMRIDANGQEGVLEELQRRVWTYGQTRYDALLTDYDLSNRSAVYIIDRSEPPEENMHFVFTDKAVLSSIRLRSFVRDCRVVERPPGELAARVEAERSLLASFLETQHAEAVREYDPKVSHLRKRRKVLVMNGALD